MGKKISVHTCFLLEPWLGLAMNALAVFGTHTTHDLGITNSLPCAGGHTSETIILLSVYLCLDTRKLQAGLWHLCRACLLHQGRAVLLGDTRIWKWRERKDHVRFLRCFWWRTFIQLSACVCAVPYLIWHPCSTNKIDEVAWMFCSSKIMKGFVDGERKEKGKRFDFDVVGVFCVASLPWCDWR